MAKFILVTAHNNNEDILLNIELIAKVMTGMGSTKIFLTDQEHPILVGQTVAQVRDLIRDAQA